MALLSYKHEYVKTRIDREGDHIHYFTITEKRIRDYKPFDEYKIVSDIEILFSKYGSIYCSQLIHDETTYITTTGKAKYTDKGIYCLCENKRIYLPYKGRYLDLMTKEEYDEKYPSKFRKSKVK